MSIFESGVRDDRRAVGARFVSGVADAERMRRPVERIGRAHVPRHAEGGRGAFGEMIVGIGRLFFPIALLVTAAAAALIYGDAPARFLGDIDVGGKPFDAGVLALPLTLFIVHLTNRRYGASYAIVQLLGATAIVIAAAIYGRDDLMLLRGTALPASRVIVAFGCALFLAQLVSIFVFDRLRGPHWWQAPLVASTLGGVVLALIAYPAAYLGGALWLAPMFSYMGVAAVTGFLMLVPYWLLRAIIAPLPGYGGY